MVQVMDKHTIHEVRQWLIKADHDLRSTARLMSGDDDEPLFDTAVYHCQQAAEKAFKAYLTARLTGTAGILIAAKRPGLFDCIEPLDELTPSRPSAGYWPEAFVGSGSNDLKTLGKDVTCRSSYG